ncbi:polysaccharide biosynthesis/export family protein [uncultured Draconibacterium sp.]|uniref:polysaccharide biosynthesis/export family protein n=1 Tax=uncultured Draconibacterium sp. TaxID=1573823 RepID=UPI0029C6F431|nr:polysaccharide biosynthesis/export family protein [uncultured Draconibacterium sp.]
MKHTHLLIFLAMLLFTSCVSTRDITMFREKKDLNTYYDIPTSVPDHRIQPFDNLYLSVLTLDPEVNKLFNPSLEGSGIASGTQQMYGSRSSQYINGYMVSEEGTINLPIMGEINLEGLTLHEAQVRLKERATEYLKEPTVQVKFLNYKVNIIGEVVNPGIYYNYEGTITLLDALSMANGITTFANIEDVVVKRTDKADRVITLNVNLNDNSIYSSEAYFLQPNDVIYIPPSKLKRRSERSDTYTQILSTISTIVVAVALVVNL